MATDNNYLIKIGIQGSVERIEELLNTGILTFNGEQFFESEEFKNPFRKSAMIEILINLRDLMHKCESLAGKRISFDDNIVKMKYKVKNRKGEEKEEEIKDITDVIEFMRNAVCHIEDIDKRWLTAMIFLDSCWSINDSDVCFEIGKQKLYLKKGVKRALEEAKGVLVEYLVDYHRRNKQRKFSEMLSAYVQNNLKGFRTWL